MDDTLSTMNEHGHQKFSWRTRSVSGKGEVVKTYRGGNNLELITSGGKENGMSGFFDPLIQRRHTSLRTPIKVGLEGFSWGIKV